MNIVLLIYRELVGMFIDDGYMAVFVLILIAIVTGLVELAGVPALWGAVALLIGSLIILAESVRRASRST